jgi:nickel/cobalt exporter
MSEALIYLASSFWLGAAHAITPGHGKTIAAAYIVGARGRPVDAVVLGIFVTLSHTSGIVLVGVLASLGLPGIVPQRIEAWMKLATGLLVIVIGLWTLWTQRELFPVAGWARRTGDQAGPGYAPLAHANAGSHAYAHSHVHDRAHSHAHDHDHSHGHGRAHTHDHEHAHEHDGTHAHDHTHEGGPPGYHSHGWGFKHTHNVDLVTTQRPGMWMLIGLGVAGGLLPDPAALAILLSALAQGKVMLGLGTVLVFSVGFAATLVVVGVVAAIVGQRILTWLAGPTAARLQIFTSLVIVAMGAWLTAKGWQDIVAFG